jgi:hypothetical protein
MRLNPRTHRRAIAIDYGAAAVTVSTVEPTTESKFAVIEPVPTPAPFAKPPHARYYWLMLAESHLTRRLFGARVGRIAALTGGDRVAERR